MEWQEEYARELLRTSGKTCRFIKKGSWYRLVMGSQPEWAGQSYRKDDIIKMTERLKLLWGYLLMLMIQWGK